MLNGKEQPIWTAHGARQRRLVEHSYGLGIALAAALASAGAVLIAALFLLPSGLVFPVTAFGLVLGGGTFALIAWASPREVTNRLVFWDIAGAVTVLGFCAALLGEPEQAIALLERDR